MTPITETVVVVAIVATSFVVTAVCYLLVLARMGRPLRVNFSGYGVRLSVGSTTICEADDSVFGNPHAETTTKE